MTQAPLRSFFMSLCTPERVLDVRHWSETVFSFTTTRPASLRFRSGNFLMLGLEIDRRPLLRAYSIASAHYDDHLEFVSIKVPDGPLTSRLAHVAPGDTVLIGRKPTGTLVPESLLPGETLYLLATGTGLAPFLSLLRDPELYTRFARVVLVHGVRRVADLAFAEYLQHELPAHELVGDAVGARLSYYPTVTREPFRNTGRITPLLDSGRLAADLGLPPLDARRDRVMICGGPAMLRDTVDLLEARGFLEGSGHTPGHYVIERAFVGR